MERIELYAVDAKVAGRQLTGVVHVYGSVTQDSRRHRFQAGAFADSIAAGHVVSFAFHDLTKPLGTQKAGTLRLEDGASLGFAIDLPDTSYANDLKAYVEAGNDLGMSFQVSPKGKPVRAGGIATWSAGDLISVDPVAMPAFPGTAVELHSAQDPEEITSQITKIKARSLAKSC